MIHQKLYFRYDKRQKDFVGDTKLPRIGNADIRLVMGHLLDTPTVLKTNLIDELQSRGYDPKTIRFSIEKKL